MRKIMRQFISGILLTAVFLFTHPSQATLADLAMCMDLSSSVCIGWGTSGGFGSHLDGITPVFYAGNLNVYFDCYTTLPPPNDIILMTGCGTVFPTNASSSNSSPPVCPATQSGSIIGIDNQALDEEIPVVGAPFKLHYSTNWALGRAADYTINTEVTDSNVPVGPTSWLVGIRILGNLLSANTYPNGANIVDTYVWDGTDGSGNMVPGSTLARVSIASGSFPVAYEIPVGNLKAILFGVGGWMPDVLHFYDVTRGQLLKGDGSTRLVAALTLPGGDLLVPEPDGSLVYIFDSTGRHLNTKSGILGTTLFTFNYDGSGRLTTIDQPFSRTTTFHRDGSGNLTSIESPWGDSSTVTLTGTKLLSSITNPNSEAYTLTYKTGTDLLETFTKPNSAVSTFTYDVNGLLTDDSHSGGSSSSISSSGSFIGASIALLSNLNVQTNFNLNRADVGNYTRTTSLPSGSTRSFTISPSTISSTQGGVTISRSLANDPRFGALGFYSSTHSESTRSTTQSQVAALVSGDPLMVTNMNITTTLNSQDTNIFYDGSSKTYTLTTPEGRVGTRTIDTYERTISSQWGSDNAFNFTYTNDQLTNINVGSRYTTPHYDAGTGLMDSVRNAMGETTAYTYDSAKRLTYITYPDSRYVQFSYDAAGNLTGVTPPGKSIHNLPLNGHEILGAYQPPSLGMGISVNTTYTYDNDKHLTLITRPDTQTISFSWNGSTGLLDSMTTPDGTYYYYPYTYYEKIATATTPSSAVNYLNYSDGRLSQDQSLDSGGTIGTFGATYNTLLQMDSDTVTPGSGSPLTANYTYDNDELLSAAGDLTISRNAGDGRISGTAVALVTDTWTHNNYGELDNYVLKFNSSTIFSYTITRDGLGRVDTLSETVQGNTDSYDYDYDNAGRLTDVTKNSSAYSHYNFDSNSNRSSGNTGGTSFTATIDAHDRQTAYNLFNYTFNESGELATKVHTLLSQTTTYVYDVLGNLKSVTLPSTDVVTYDIDAFNRRISRSYNASVTSKYLYSGDRIIAELDGSNAVKYRFVYGTKSHVPDYMTDGTDTYRIVTDHLGSVRLVVHVTTGTVAQKIAYNELGRVLSDTSPGFQPFGYAGGLYDPDTRIIRFGARDYDPDTGRWMSKDPILFAGGDSNLYGYVLQDPVNLIDPLGLSNSSIEGGGPMDWGGTGAVIIPTILTGLPILDTDTFLSPVWNQNKGERGNASKESGTENPFKKLRPHPTDPNKVIKKDSHTGKEIEKPKPPGFDDYWNKKRGC